MEKTERCDKMGWSGIQIVLECPLEAVMGMTQPQFSLQVSMATQQTHFVLIWPLFWKHLCTLSRLCPYFTVRVMKYSKYGYF